LTKVNREIFIADYVNETGIGKFFVIGRLPARFILGKGEVVAFL
jgi:hypothetical protein